MGLKIFLLGYMASGKSFLGRSIAPKFDFSYLDLDDMIIDHADMSISEIFEKKGEKEFRELESKALSWIALKESKKLIISTGGGTPCFNDNMKIIRNSGISIFLDCDPEIIVNRLLASKRIRPIVEKLKENELLTFVQNHLQERSEFYEMADYSLKITEHKDENLKSLTDLIASLINPEFPESQDKVV